MTKLIKILEDIETAFNVLKHHLKLISKENKELKQQIKRLKDHIEIILEKVVR